MSSSENSMSGIEIHTSALLTLLVCGHWLFLRRVTPYLLLSTKASLSAALQKLMVNESTGFQHGPSSQDRTSRTTFTRRSFGIQRLNMNGSQRVQKSMKQTEYMKPMLEWYALI